MDSTNNTKVQDKAAKAARRADAMARLKEKKDLWNGKKTKDADDQGIIPDHDPAPAFEDATAAPRAKKRQPKEAKFLVEKKTAAPKKTKASKKSTAPTKPSRLAKVTAVNEAIEEEKADDDGDLDTLLRTALEQEEAARPTTEYEPIPEIDNDGINITAAEAGRYKNAAVAQMEMNDRMNRSIQYKRYDPWGELMPSSLDAMGVTKPSVATAKAQAAAVDVQVARPKVDTRTITRAKAKQLRGGDDMPELGSLDGESESMDNVSIVSDDEEEAPEVKMPKQPRGRAHMEVIINPNGKFVYPDLPAPVETSAPLKRKHAGGLALPQKATKVSEATPAKRIQDQEAADDLQQHHEQTTASAEQRPVKAATGAKGAKKSNEIPVDDATWWDTPIADDANLFGEDGEEETAGATEDATAAENESTPTVDQTTPAEDIQADEFNIKKMLSNGSLAELASLAGEDVGTSTENDSTESTIDESAVMAGVPVPMAAVQHDHSEENSVKDGGERVDSVLASSSPSPQETTTAPVEVSKKRAREVDENHDDEEVTQPSAKKTKIEEAALGEISKKRAREIDENYDDDEETQPSVKKTKVDEPGFVFKPAPVNPARIKTIAPGPFANMNTKRPSRQPAPRNINNTTTPAATPSTNIPPPRWSDKQAPTNGFAALEQRNRQLRAKKQEDEQEREPNEYAAAVNYEKRRDDTKQRRLSGEDVDESDEEGESMAHYLARKQTQADKVAESKRNKLAMEKKMKARGRKQ